MSRVSLVAPRRSGSGGLKVEGLSFGYRGTEELLFDRLSWSFNPGSVTAVTGPSGRGKSTMLFILGLLLRPGAGTIIWQGRRVEQLSDVERSQFRAMTVGFVFQDAALDSTRSVRDNICEVALYLGVSRARAVDRAEELLTTFGVTLRSSHRPGEVSGGQAQRVALCRALFNEPPLVLADEPTGNLDSEAKDLVLTGLHRAAERGATVVVSTHDPVVLRRCDSQLVL